MPDGRVYEGGFKNGVQNGDGVLYKNSGTVIRGKWEMGRMAEKY